MQERMIIYQINMHNFKSYEDHKTIGPFHHKFSAIIGPNGSGKSNLIDSLIFVFGKKASWMWLKKLKELIHNSSERICHEAYVEVIFKKVIDREEDQFDFLNEEITIRRTINQNNVSNYFLNGNKESFENIKNLLLNNKIDLDKNRFMILQGEVEQIAIMKPISFNPESPGLLEYLEDIIGSDQYLAQIEKLSQELNELETNKLQKSDQFFYLEKDMQEIQQDKDRALDFIHQEEKLHKLKLFEQHLMIFKQQKEIDKINKRIDELHQQRKIYSDQMDEQKRKNQSVLDFIKGKNEQQKSLEEEMKKLDDKILLQKNEFNEVNKKMIQIMKDFERINIEKQEGQQRMNQIINRKGELGIKQKNYQNQLADYSLKFSDLDWKISEPRKKYESQLRLIDKEIQQVENQIISRKENAMSLQKKFDMLNNENDKLEKELDDLKGKESLLQEEIKTIKKESSQDVSFIQRINDTLKQLQTKKEDFNNQQKLQQGNLNEITQEMIKKQNLLQSFKEEKQTSNQQNRILDWLMEAQRRGVLEGIQGTLGQLISTNSRFDIAISTAGAGSLNKIVVNSLHQAEKAIQFLKENKIGRAGFFALDKIKSFENEMREKFDLPENAQRVIDVIELESEDIRNLVYQVFRNTLIVEGYQNASNLAYGKYRGIKVVSQCGKMIDENGLLSVRQIPIKGLIRLKNHQGKQEWPGNPQEIEQELIQLNINRETIQENLRQISQQISLCQNDEKMLRIKIQEDQENWVWMESRLLDKENEIKEILTWRKNVQESLQKNVNKKQLEEIQEQIKQNQKEINQFVQQKEKCEQKRMQIGDPQFQKLFQEFQQLETDIRKCEQECREVEVQLKLQENQMIQEQKQMENLDQEEISQKKMKSQQEDMLNKIVTIATEYTQQKETFEDQINVIQEEKKKEKDKLEEFNKFLIETKQKMTELENQKKILLDQRDQEEQEQDKRKQKIDHINQAYISNQKQYDFLEDLKQIEELENKREILSKQKFDNYQEIYSLNFEQDIPEQILINHQQNLQDIKTKIDVETQHQKSTLPNLNVLSNFLQKYKGFLEQRKNLENIKKNASEKLQELQNLKEKRLSEFNQGFQQISQAMKETYRTLTNGGDAELESLEIKNPFSKGVVFSVKPNKTWSQISLLSGGQKTLVSLSFIYALHQYKPNAVYFMDEIDAALDFKNRSLVGNFIKEKTKNSQFIVVSLNNELFEKADLLVGIYKVNNISHSVSLDVVSLLQQLKINQDQNEQQEIPA